jgi:hypothetical protein
MVEYTTDCADTVLNTSPDPSELYWNLLIQPDPANMNELTSPILLA